MKQTRRQLLFLGLAGAGVGLICLAGFSSNRSIEQALLGQSSRALAWGPTLFRILLGLHGLGLVFVGLKGAQGKPAMDAHRGPQKEVEDSAKGGWQVWAALGGLSFLATVLRLWQLNSCLWLDEILTLVDFARLPLGQLVSSFPHWGQHMLYAILAHVSIRIFGESAWALRLPAVLFGVGSLWALFLLGRRLIGTLPALLGCMVLTVSYHHIWFSQNARGYTALMFFATLAVWLWLEARSRDAWGWWIAYALALFACLWVHLTMVFVVAGHVLVSLLVLLWSRWNARVRGQERNGAGRSWLMPLLAFALCGSLTLQAYALPLPQLFTPALWEGVKLRVEWSNPFWVLQESLRSLQVGWSGIVAVLLGGLFALVGWISVFRREWGAALMMVLPVLLVATMLVLGYPLWPRFFFFSMGFGLLIAVEGAMAVPRLLLARASFVGFRIDPAKAVGVALCLLMMGASLPALARYYALPKQDYMGARDYVESRRAEHEVVVAAGLGGIPFARYYAPHWILVLNKVELDRVRRDHPRVWLVYTIPIQIRANSPELWQAIEQEFDVVKVFPGTLGDGEIYVCREEPREENTRFNQRFSRTTSVGKEAAPQQ